MYLHVRVCAYLLDLLHLLGSTAQLSVFRSTVYRRCQHNDTVAVRHYSWRRCSTVRYSAVLVDPTVDSYVRCRCYYCVAALLYKLLQACSSYRYRY